MFFFQKKFVNTGKQGFTLIELLVVIAIIALLSSVVLASLSQARIKARDAKRFADMRQIYNALQIYQDRYGCIPRTSSNDCGVIKNVYFANTGGWDYSSQGNFLPFLSMGTEPIMSTVPVDPINNMTGDYSPTSTYGYRYFCYPNEGLALGYFTESRPWTNSSVWYGIYKDPDFTCK